MAADASRRIGDRERDAAVDLLQQAVADGRLDVEELTARLDVAMKARTEAELEPVIHDLVGAPGSLELAGPPPISRPRPPGYSAQDPLLLDGARVGAWRPPPFIRIDISSRWVRLDFQFATTDLPVIDIDVAGGAGWGLIVLPDGWAADLDRLVVGYGSTSVKVPSEPAAGKPLLLVHGAVGAGRVTLRTPNRRDRRIAGRRMRDRN